MQLTVLGKSPAWQDRGGACSGYLVREGDFTLLLECGSGVFAKLREVSDYGLVDAVLISHLHADHFLDLVPYSYALLYSPRSPQATGGDPSVPSQPSGPALYAPPTALATFRRVVSSWRAERLIENAFECREYDPGATLQLGSLRARFREVPHFTQAFAIELSSPAGRRFTFGADCAPNDALVEFASETDLLVVEATLESPEPVGKRGHMTPREAGELARRAGARRLVLTHFSDEMDAAWIREEAVASFEGDVELAHEGAEFTV
ncbi:MAG: MBL fold metallo-hydrolase [Solirubrobacteraceae bacterium]